MIRKFITPYWCWFFGHDMYFPHPNKQVWSCARCNNGPADRGW